MSKPQQCAFRALVVHAPALDSQGNVHSFEEIKPGILSWAAKHGWNSDEAFIAHFSIGTGVRSENGAVFRCPYIFIAIRIMTSDAVSEFIAELAEAIGEALKSETVYISMMDEVSSISISSAHTSQAKEDVTQIDRVPSKLLN
jgi:hypothetical protein